MKMVISVPISSTTKRVQVERNVEIQIPGLGDLLRKNKIVSAFITVISAPVK